MDNYIQMHKEMHQQNYNTFAGKSLVKHISIIDRIIKQYECKTFLDYGCGKALYHPKHWKFDKYDPCYAPFSKKPNNVYDLVICTDVMEHIPEYDVERVIIDLFQYTEKFLFCSICTRAAKKQLPNGQNAHSTIKTQDWWENKFALIFNNQKNINLIFS